MENETENILFKCSFCHHTPFLSVDSSKSDEDGKTLLAYFVRCDCGSISAMYQNPDMAIEHWNSTQNKASLLTMFTEPNPYGQELSNITRTDCKRTTVGCKTHQDALSVLNTQNTMEANTVVSEYLVKAVLDELASRTASVLGKRDHHTVYAELHSHLSDAYRHTYSLKDGLGWRKETDDALAKLLITLLGFCGNSSIELSTAVLDELKKLEINL